MRLFISALMLLFSTSAYSYDLSLSIRDSGQIELREQDDLPIGTAGISLNYLDYEDLLGGGIGIFISPGYYLSVSKRVGASISVPISATGVVYDHTTCADPEEEIGECITYGAAMLYRAEAELMWKFKPVHLGFAYGKQWTDSMIRKVPQLDNEAFRFFAGLSF